MGGSVELTLRRFVQGITSGTLLEVIQNREGVSQKIREIILGRKKRRGGSLQN